MSAARALLLFACCAAAAVQAQDDVVDWRDAARCVGRQCGLRGTVVATEPSGPTIRLFFDVADHSVRVILMRGWLVDWPPYVGRTIIANGKVQRFHDHIEMIVLDPDDIAVIGGEPLPGATAESTVAPTMVAPTPPPPIAPTEVPTFIAPPPIVPQTVVPPTVVPPIVVPPTVGPPTVVPPTVVPPTVVPPTGAAPAPTPTSSEVEQLRQRVRELEQRIEQLEGH